MAAAHGGGHGGGGGGGGGGGLGAIGWLIILVVTSVWAYFGKAVTKMTAKPAAPLHYAEMAYVESPSDDATAGVLNEAPIDPAPAITMRVVDEVPSATRGDDNDEESPVTVRVVSPTPLAPVTLPAFKQPAQIVLEKEHQASRREFSGLIPGTPAFNARTEQSSGERVSSSGDDPVRQMAGHRSEILRSRLEGGGYSQQRIPNSPTLGPSSGSVAFETRGHRSSIPRGHYNSPYPSSSARLRPYENDVFGGTAYAIGSFGVRLRENSDYARRQRQYGGSRWVRVHEHHHVYLNPRVSTGGIR